MKPFIDYFITIISVLIFLTNRVLSRQIDYCYADEEDPYLYMATRTAYHFVHGGKTRFQPVANCSPMQMWVLSRHGTTYPGAELINMLQTLPTLRKQILYNHETRGYGHLCEKDLTNLQNWVLDAKISSHTAKYLTSQGEEDMRLLARRLQSNFPELLQLKAVNITSENYKFRSTNTQRTRESMKAFMEGLFGPYTVHEQNSPVPDYVLNMENDCTHWINKTYTEQIELKEKAKFVQGSEFQNLIQNVSRRLGFDHNIKQESIKLMYEVCRLEKAINVGDVSAWCAVFSKEELQVLEYSEDIEYYYWSGYGREVNKNIGCFPLQNMFWYFRKLERGINYDEPKGIFYFTHSTVIQSLLMALDMEKDPIPINAYNYKSLIKRKWKTSFISPFAANLVAIFYKCNDPQSPNKVMFYLQEKPVLYEGCEVGLCDWEYLKNKLGDLANQCNPNFCSATNQASARDNSSLISVIVLSLLLILYKN